MDKGDTLASTLERVLDCHTHQAFCRKYGDRLNADSGICAYLLLATLQHFFVEEFDQLGGFGSSLLPLDSGINVFGVLAEDDDVHALGILHRRGCALVVLHRSDAGIEIENLTQSDVKRANPAADRRGQRAFDGHAKFFDCVNRVLRKPIIEFCLGFFSSKDFVPDHAAFPAISFFDGRIEDAHRGFPDIASGAVAFDKRNDWIGRSLAATIFISDARAVAWNAALGAVSTIVKIGASPVESDRDTLVHEHYLFALAKPGRRCANWRREISSAHCARTPTSFLGPD